MGGKQRDQGQEAAVGTSEADRDGQLRPSSADIPFEEEIKIMLTKWADLYHNLANGKIQSGRKRNEDESVQQRRLISGSQTRSQGEGKGGDMSVFIYDGGGARATDRTIRSRIRNITSDAKKRAKG